jgi:hypothetical protein
VVACTPHPGYGTVSIERRPGIVRTVDLATCRTRTAATRRVVIPTLRISTNRVAGTEMILYRGRVVFRHRWREGGIELFGQTPDRAWVLFAIDPQNSASLAADGLRLEAAPVVGGRARVVATGLLADDYRTWCGGRLVMTAGGDRLAGHHKWLIVTGPPTWRARILVRDPKRAFGSLACAGDSVVVQSARDVGPNDNAQPDWSLWRVRLADGKASVLDTPPRGYSDDAPRVARNGRVVFVRSHKSHGVLYALGGGPLVDVGRDDGYYGHRPWTFLTWSPARG